MVLLLFCTTAVHAQDNSAREVAEWCRPILGTRQEPGRIRYPATADAGRCVGTFYTLLTYRFELSGGRVRFCLPDMTTYALISIFVQAVDRNPDSRNFDWDAFINYTFPELYPCRR